MVAFPGETEDDHRATLEVIERAGFTGLHVFRYSPRPRTAAARYDLQVPVAEAQERSREAIELGGRLRAAYETGFEGRPLRVIWDRVLGACIRGLSENYIQVTAPADGRRPGQLEEVVWRTASSAA
jgi:threonylcarbamoyladenosine tRNA methylthiotransferase MtaB